MDHHADFDVGPLSWVKGEIDAAMQRGAQALRAFAGDPADAAQIQLARAQLHQAHGALAVVGLDGVTQVSRQLEALLAAIERDEGRRGAEAVASALRGFEAIVEYLDQLLSGAPNQSLRLLPVYRELVAALGSGEADAVDLYFPDLSLKPPRRERPPVALRRDEEERYLREQRARYQRGMLAWMRGDPGAAAEMGAAVGAIEAAQVPAQRAFWWAAMAFFDALAAGALPADADAKRLCNRIEQQIRRLLEGSQAVAERLMRETLYLVAQAHPVTAQVDAVRSAYRLEATIPSVQAAAPATHAPEAQAFKAAREALAQAKGAWGRHAAGTRTALAQFRTAADSFLERATALGTPDLALLARDVAMVGAWISSNPGAMSEAVALEVATALLLAENALETIATLDADFGRHAEFVRSRLQACVEGRLLRTAPTMPLLDEMSRRAQERLLMNQLVAEMQSNLRHIEQTLDAFFRNPAARGGLEELERPLHQVRGALEMLGEARARDELDRCSAQIREFVQSEAAPPPQEFERLAQSLSGLGFYVDALAHGGADFDQAMRPIEVERDAAAQAPSVEAQLAQQKREAEIRFDQWKKKPTDTWLKSGLQQNLAEIRRHAGLVADAGLEDRAQQALRMLEDEQAMPLEAGVAQAIVEVLPAAATAASTPEAARLLEASDERVDAELLSVFLEEALEVLAAIGSSLAILRANPADRDALVVIRRGFHTLKGSGRMVGLLRLAETAWALEQALNRWLQEQRAAGEALLALVGDAHRYFSENVAQLKGGGAISDEQALVAAAERLSSIEPAAAVEPVPPEPAVVPEAPAAGPVAMPASEPPVSIGGEPVSAPLFASFVQESRGHLAAIAAERETLVAHGVITDALLRAAHTLAGICSAVKARAASELGYALEQALERLAAGALSEPEEHLIGETIEALEAMVGEVLERRSPPARPELLEALARAGVAVAAAPEMLPEEEGALDRSAAAGEAAGPGERRQRRLDDDIDPILLPVFLEEAHELVPAVAETLRGWRNAPQTAVHGRSLARLLHTFKGSARMAGAMALGELTHNMEARVEAGLALAEPPAALLDELDASLERMDQLWERLQRAGAAPAAGEAPASGGPSPERDRARALLRVPTETIDRMVNEAGEVAIARGRIETEMRALRAAMHELTDNVARLRGQVREIEIQAESQMQSRIKEVHEANQSFDPLELDRFTRFQELTRLMTESVSDVHTVHQNLAHAVDQTAAALAAQARRNRELQQDLMRVRMVPFSSLTERLHRIVRQCARETGRRAALEIRGMQVEVDRSVLERVTAPLEHLVRNAVVHGIESPEERVASGKPETGEIRIEIAQETNEVVVTVADDGRGLDLARIRERARASGLIAAGTAPAEAEIAEWIFLPGFTTAAEVTQIAGRGVGMDVVRTEVAALGGRVELKFERARGTRVALALPLTLATAHAVLVRGGARTCAIPAVMVEQVLQMSAEQFAAALGAGEVQWQERRARLYALHRLLAEPQASEPAQRQHVVLLLRSGVHSISLAVDEMFGASQEIVVKPIGPQLQRVEGITGATVLGTGEIVLIVNPVQLALRLDAGRTAPAPALVAPAQQARPLVMVVDDSLTVRKVTERLLAREGYEALLARDGVEAMELLRETRPAVMLVDIEMPRMDGFELTRSVRADPRLADIPIIMITSRTADKHRSHAGALGVNAYFGKPYGETELLAALAGFVAAGAARGPAPPPGA